MEDKKYTSRGSKLVDLALKQTAKREDEEKGINNQTTIFFKLF